MHRGWLEGYVALVTGGGTGIGRAVVDRFVAEGAKVCAMVRSAADGMDLIRDHGDAVSVIEGDVRSAGDNAAAVAATLDRFGRLDTLVANAGIWDFFLSLEATHADVLAATFDEIMAVNVKGSLLSAKAAVPALRESHGSIIMTVSNAGFHAGGGGPVYVASKHAQVGLIRQLAYELAPDVRVNGVAPGATATGLRGAAAAGQAERSLEDVEGLEDAVSRTLPLGFVAQPQDHAGLYVVLASRENARCTTGDIFRSDGGWEVRAPGRRPGRRTA